MKVCCKRRTSLERIRYLTSRPLNTASVCESNSLAGVTVVVPAVNKSRDIVSRSQLWKGLLTLAIFAAIYHAHVNYLRFHGDFLWRVVWRVVGDVSLL